MKKSESISDILSSIGADQPVKTKSNGHHKKAAVSEENIFWYATDKNTISVDVVKYMEFLQQQGYSKIYIGKNPVYVHVKENIFEEVNVDSIKDFVIRYVESLSDPLPLTGYPKADLKQALLKQVRFYFSDQLLSTIKTIEFKKHKDSRDTAYFYYTNCFVEITSTGIKAKPYKHLDSNIWRSQIINRFFMPEEIKGKDISTVFARFMFNVAGQDMRRFFSLMTITGYLLHGYKSQAKPAAVILCDEVISDNPEGGTGKGIYIKGIKKLKNTATIEGKNFKFDKSFVWQRVGPETQLLAFEDVEKRFQFEKLFSMLTEGITVERKNMNEFYIPFEDAPKVIITTNYTIDGIGNSHDRRRIEFEFSQYYNGIKTPFTDFGHMLFDDWDEGEWGGFDNFMMCCVEHYLREGVVNYNKVNLARRKLIQQTCDEFVEFMDGITYNRLYGRKELYGFFINEYPEVMKKCSTHRFFKFWIPAFILYSGKVSDVKNTRNANERFLEFIPVSDTSVT